MSGHGIFEADCRTERRRIRAHEPSRHRPHRHRLAGFRRIRSRAPNSFIISENRGIMLIALTGYGSPEDRRRAQQASFDTHLVKPLNFDLLEDLLTTPGEPILEKSAVSQR